MGVGWNNEQRGLAVLTSNPTPILTFPLKGKGLSFGL